MKPKEAVLNPAAPTAREDKVRDNGTETSSVGEDSVNRQEFTPNQVPRSVRESFDATARALGGLYTPSREARGAVGYTHFDGPNADDGTVTVLIDKKNLDQL